MASNRLYRFNNPLIDASTKQVLATHSVKVVFSNFDGDSANTFKLIVKQTAPNYRVSGALLNLINSFIIFGLLLLAYLI